MWELFYNSIYKLEIHQFPEGDSMYIYNCPTGKNW
jgi:hypothetical protein